MNLNESRRITVILNKPNSLFEKWLIEWRDDANRRGSDMHKTFNYALLNLRKCKIPLASGKESKILKGFGDKLCKMLDDKLIEYRNNAGNSFKITNSTKKQKETLLNKPEKLYHENYNLLYNSKGYAILMSLSSNCFDEVSSTLLSKDDVLHLGKYILSSSFIKFDTGSYDTANSLINILLEKSFIVKKGKPIQYSLTQKGYSVVRTIAEANRLINRKKEMMFNTLKVYSSSLKGTQKIASTSIDQNEITDYMDNPVISKQKINLPSIETLKKIISPSSGESTLLDSSGHLILCSASSDCSSQCANNGNTIKCKSVQKFLSEGSVLRTKSHGKDSLCQKNLKKCISQSSLPPKQDLSQEEDFIFKPNSFDVILYIDSQEATGSSIANQDNPLLKHLHNNSVIFAGRHRQSKKELVLPHIIERKRLDDFASSIKDGRYHEQKFRLKKSGIQNLTYLIEQFDKYVGLPRSTLFQAAANTAIQDEFNIKFTTNLKHTAKFLASFSKMLYTNYKDKTLLSCPKVNLSNVVITDNLISLMTFNEFNKASLKNKPLSVNDLFIKMLIQLNGMSVEKACAIVAKYPSPAVLKEAFAKNTPSQGEKLLGKLTFGKYKKIIGSVLSKTVYDLFTMEKF